MEDMSMPAIKIHHTETSDAVWDGPAAKANLKNDGDESYYRSAFAWQDPEGDNTKKANYKFIHHEVSADGTVGAANLAACSTGIGVLNGGRGGTTIPAADKKGVHAHLAAHITDAGKEAPPLTGEAAEDDTIHADYCQADICCEEEPVQTVARRRTAKREREPAMNSTFQPTRLLRAICSIPWAIEEPKLDAILDLVYMRAAGIKADEETIAFWQSAAKPVLQQGGAVAVLPLFGTISQRMGMMADFSGGTSTESFSRMFDQAMADRTVKTIIIDSNSPGGTIYGVDELSQKIYKARGQGKNILGMIQPLSASAAYWILSACNEISIMPTGEVGSIGVFAAHVDESALAERMGVRTTLISAGKYKTEASPYEPLGNDARAAMQERVDEYYNMFVKAVARNRGTTMDAVINGYGEGRVVGAKKAAKLGMVDHIETMEQLLGRLGMDKATVMPMNRAEDEGLSIDARERRLRLLDVV